MRNITFTEYTLQNITFTEYTLLNIHLQIYIAEYYIWRYGSVLGPPCPSTCLRGKPIGRESTPPCPSMCLHGEV